MAKMSMDRSSNTTVPYFIAKEYSKGKGEKLHKKCPGI
jgi:hypothetical protein